MLRNSIASKARSSADGLPVLATGNMQKEEGAEVVRITLIAEPIGRGPGGGPGKG